MEGKWNHRRTFLHLGETYICNFNQKNCTPDSSGQNMPKPKVNRMEVPAVFPPYIPSLFSACANVNAGHVAIKNSHGTCMESISKKCRVHFSP